MAQPRRPLVAEAPDFWYGTSVFATDSYASPDACTRPRSASVGSRSARSVGRLPSGKGIVTTTITTRDGTQIFYKVWGPRSAQPIMFHHGWPFSADDWDNQMLFFLGHGYRVVAHDRRGHGRSSQTSEGNEMNTYAADVAELVTALDLRGAVHIGHSTDGGKGARYVARDEPGRVARAILIDAVPPLILRTEANPGGMPVAAFDGYRAAVASNRAQAYIDVPAGPF